MAGGSPVDNDGSILRSVDGGKTWLNATPPGIDPFGYSANLTALNTNTAWVLVPGTGGAPPAAPTNLVATAVSSSQINLTWTDNSNNETGFKIERCIGSGCTSFDSFSNPFSSGG
jgi:hypothetical protein